MSINITIVKHETWTTVTMVHAFSQRNDVWRLTNWLENAKLTENDWKTLRYISLDQTKSNPLNKSIAKLKTITNMKANAKVWWVCDWAIYIYSFNWIEWLRIYSYFTQHITHSATVERNLNSMVNDPSADVWPTINNLPNGYYVWYVQLESIFIEA